MRASTKSIWSSRRVAMIGAASSMMPPATTSSRASTWRSIPRSFFSVRPLAIAASTVATSMSTLLLSAAGAAAMTRSTAARVAAVCASSRLNSTAICRVTQRAPRFCRSPVHPTATKRTMVRATIAGRWRRGREAEFMGRVRKARRKLIDCGAGAPEPQCIQREPAQNTSGTKVWSSSGGRMYLILFCRSGSARWGWGTS